MYSSNGTCLKPKKYNLKDLEFQKEFVNIAMSSNAYIKSEKQTNS